MSDGGTSQVDLLPEIRDSRLGAYLAQRSDILEHFNLENEIAQNYQGRLIYELLQNADDAMDEGGLEDRVLIRVTEDALLFANSGREISAGDVRSLCGVSISTKHARGGVRASIGHKGMGFKSVLEVTDRPAVYSTGHSFAFSRERSRDVLVDRFGSEGLPEGGRKVPVMRLPFAAEGAPPAVEDILRQGYRTVFCFPFSDPEMAERVASRLKEMSATEILFLRKLEEVRIELAATGEEFCWEISRDEWRAGSGWSQTGEMANSGITRVKVSENGSTRAFIVFSVGDLQIGENRVGLDSASWAEVTLTEVALAIPWEEQGQAGRLMPFPVEPRVHVFLGTGEYCPYPFLVNGAFNCDLSRRSVRCSEDERDYNAYLMQEAGRLFAEQVLPFAQDQEMPTASLLALLDAAAVRDKRGEPLVPSSGAANALRDAIKAHLGGVAFVPCGERMARLGEIVAFPDLEADDQLGEELRERLPTTVETEDGLVPEAPLCGPATARILRSLGAPELTYTRLPKLVAGLDEDRVRLERHPGADIGIDPVLHLVTRLWRAIPSSSPEKGPFREMVNRLPLFPTGTPDEAGVLPHTATADLTCFYPPRSLSGKVPLEGICFLSREVCWGALIPKVRNALLQAEMATWQEIWGVREFKFPEVMRATVMPRLTRDGRPEEQEELKRLDALAAICQLAGRAPDQNQSRPLPFERLGSNRALFQLARLPVPCRDGNGELRWIPAFRAYFGEDWIGDRSVEPLLHAVAAVDEEDVELPDVPLLVAPGELRGLLAQFGHVTEDAAGDGAADSEAEPSEEGDDEPEEDEDDEAALPQQETAQWRQFFTWLGVNSCLRPIGLQDVNEKGGWLNTRNLSKPQGQWCQAVGDEEWGRYLEGAKAALAKVPDTADKAAYFYYLTELEHLPTLLYLSRKHPESEIGKALLRHLARNWPRLSPHKNLTVALVPKDAYPGRRKPAIARDHEKHVAGPCFWTWRLREVPWCPTGHGPRLPNDVWLPSQEVKRRFGVKGGGGQTLLPTLPEDCVEKNNEYRTFLSLLGLRQELTPSTFRPKDAVALTGYLEQMLEGAPPEGQKQALRTIARPAYRQLVDLLPPIRDGGPWRDAKCTLERVRLLVHDGGGHLRFKAARECLYTNRRDCREWLGLDGESLWTFVLEATPAARGPLREYFGVRVLEEEIQWLPSPGEPALDEDGRRAFRQGLNRVGAYLLCMLETDRSADRLVQRDLANLRAFIRTVEPVTQLWAEWHLPDGLKGKRSPREYLIYKPSTKREAGAVGADGDSAKKPFIRWEEEPWPARLDQRTAVRLASAICDYLEVSAVVQLMTILQARPEDWQLILRRAGAPHEEELEEKLSRLMGSEQAAPTGLTADLSVFQPAPTVPDFDGEGEAPPPMLLAEGGGCSSELEDQPPPLYGFDEILIDGVPVELIGQGSAPRRSRESDGSEQGSSGVGAPRSGGRHRSRDHYQLDALGMQIAMGYERHRIALVARSAGDHAAGAGLTADDGDELVFDVSRPERIGEARESSLAFREAYRLLVDEYRLNPDHPGFDILSLRSSGAVERCIELKSSGVAARIQEMTWNEWKVSNTGLAELYYLYLVGNLRADLPDAPPFVRTIHNPVNQLLGFPMEEQSTRRKVQLHVASFRRAEELVLQVGDSGRIRGVGDGRRD